MAKKKSGFSLTELLVVLAIFSFVSAALFSMLSGAQSNFFNVDATIDLRSNLRLTSEKIGMELSNTGYQNSVAQFTITPGANASTPDVIRFSIPILCSAASALIDSNGVPANWGAPLTWGCNSHTCMDANGSCATLEYKHIQYSLNGSNQLERKVLDGALATVGGSTTVLGHNISNFKVSLSPDTRVITVTLTGSKTSLVRKVLTETYTRKILLNNLNG